MKIFGWMQTKFNSKFGCNNNNNNSHSIPFNRNHEHHENAIKQEIHRIEEFSDWPNGLLAIGTFGNSNNDVKEGDQNSKPKSDEENERYTVEEEEEEVEKLQSEDEGRNNNTESSVVVGGPKSINNVDNNTNNVINKKSLSLLVKKMFVCRAGFTPSLNIKDQVPESTVEKMLRAMLHKKIYPQNPNSTNLSTKKVLQNKRKPNCEEEEAKQKDDKGSKWVKTDSEYIVLEI